MRDGGPIPHSKQSIGELEVEAASRVLLSGHLAQGEEVAAFEAEVAAVVANATASPSHRVPAPCSWQHMLWELAPAMRLSSPAMCARRCCMR